MNTDYRRFVAALRRGIDGGVAPQTYGGVLLDEQVVRDIRSSRTVADALFVLGAAVWSADSGELEGIEIFRIAAAHGSRDAVPALAESLS